MIESQSALQLHKYLNDLTPSCLTQNSLEAVSCLSQNSLEAVYKHPLLTSANLSYFSLVRIKHVIAETHTDWYNHFLRQHTRSNDVHQLGSCKSGAQYSSRISAGIPTSQTQTLVEKSEATTNLGLRNCTESVTESERVVVLQRFIFIIKPRKELQSLISTPP